MRKLSLLIGFLGLIIAFSGCETPHMERQNVPVIFGMRLDGGTTETDVDGNYVWLKDQGYHDLMVEIPLRATLDTPWTPFVDSLQLAQVSVLASKAHTYGFQLHLALMSNNQREAFPEHSTFVYERWFRSLELIGHAVLNACGPWQPERLIIGENLSTAESYAKQWKQVFENLREQWKISVSYCSYSNRETADALWAVSDEICLSYSASVSSNPIPFCRNQNLRISALADSLNKPVFIARANLLGREPENLFNYRLRYWQEGIQLNGICLNSIYSKIGPRDSTSYYALMDEPALLSRVQAYTSGQ